MRFTFKETARYSSPGPVFYKSDRIQVGPDHNKMFTQAIVESRVNGVNTAYATWDITCEWASNHHWGISMNKHFFGRAASHKARAWCNYLLNNPPNSWNKIEYNPRQEASEQEEEKKQ